MTSTPEEQEGAEGSRVLLSGEAFRTAYERLCDGIVAIMGERDESERPERRRWAIVGIKRGGAIIARRLQADLAARVPQGAELLYGEIDISLYRDDHHLKMARPTVKGTEIRFPVEETSIVLVDDVLFTGRTVRAAMHQLLDFGRPRRIWLAVLVDRGHRELPIEPGVVGHLVETARDERVELLLTEKGDPEDGVRIARRGAP